MKTKWNKETPANEGWYWVRYRGKRGWVRCPAEVVKLTAIGGTTTLVRSARNDSWYEGPNHGGPGMKYQGKLDKTLSFGPAIPIPQGN